MFLCWTTWRLFTSVNWQECQNERWRIPHFTSEISFPSCFFSFLCFPFHWHHNLLNSWFFFVLKLQISTCNRASILSIGPICPFYKNDVLNEKWAYWPQCDTNVTPMWKILNLCFTNLCNKNHPTPHWSPFPALIFSCSLFSLAKIWIYIDLYEANLKADWLKFGWPPLSSLHIWLANSKK